MFDVSFGELLICAVIALLVLGPERLPGAVRTVGRWIGRARHTVNNFTDQIDREIRADELKRRIEEEMKKSGVNDITRQVNEALRAPLPLIGGDHLRDPGNSIAPPAAVPTPSTADDDVDAAQPVVAGTPAVAAPPAPATPGVNLALDLNTPAAEDAPAATPDPARNA